jgi:energy-coupling factor transport system permease protein
MAVVGVLFSLQLRTLGVEAACLAGGVLVLGMVRPWLRFLRVGFPMALLVFAVGFLAFGLEEGCVLALRLLVLFTVSFLVFRALPPDELADGLTRMGLPSWFSFMLTTAMRYVPLLGLRLRHIMDAQRSRGIDLRPRPGNVRNLAALVLPLLIQSFALADDLAVAMEARGFGREGRSSRRVLRMARWEYALMLGGLAGLGALIWWETGGVS